MRKPGRLSAIAALAAMLAGGAAPAFGEESVGKPVCLDIIRIHQTTVKDASTIDFHMRDGSVYRNTLRYACPDIRWFGFTYVINGPNEICDNTQPIRVLHTGETCMLGAFTQITPPGHT